MAKTKGVGATLPVVFHNAFEEHYDTGLHRYLKNLPGLGGASGKAIRLVSTYAELKAACEDAAIFWVLCLEGTYTGSTTIAPTSYTHIYGLGHVQLDWSGAAAGEMFSSATTSIVYENLHFVRTGNGYNPVYLRGDNVFLRCTVDYTGGHVYTYGDDIIIQDCPYIYRISAMFGTGLQVVNSEINILLSGRKKLAVHNCRIIRRLQLTLGSGDAEVLITATEFGGHTDAPIYFYDAAGVVYSNVKFIGCVFEPSVDTTGCIVVRNLATVTINDVLFDGCTFRNAAFAYLIPNGVQNRWRFNNNDYHDNVTTVYNFTGGTQNNFVYTNDGP